MNSESESQSKKDSLSDAGSSEKTTDEKNTGDQHDLIDLEAEFGGLSRWVWIGSFFGPGLVGASILGTYYLYAGVLGLKNLAIAILGTFFILG